MGDKRHWLVRWMAELVVLTLLVAAGLAYQFDVGERWLGWGPADPKTEPAAVAPPEGLRLPEATVVPALAGVVRPVAVDPALVAATLRPMLGRGALGRHFAVLVTDLGTGEAVFRQGAPRITPASTAKLLTATAALEALGPMTRFRTSVRWDPASRQLVLVGGGDPFLSSSPRLGAASYPRRADLQTLARRAVEQLRPLKVARVRLAFDDSYFTGPADNPAWPGSYVREGVVPPIGALWVDEGRSATGYGYSADPPARAAEVFRAALQEAGLRVRPKIVRSTARSNDPDLVSVASAPLGEIVERTLAVSDNQAAEVIARHVGLAERQDGSFLAGTAAILDVVNGLGVPTSGDRLYDGSGLSRLDLVRPETLAAVLRVAASEEKPELRQVITGLPVAGFTGSLQYRFDKGPAAARGRVRAKTGTLTGVHGLAGVADDVGGSRMAFVVVADRVAVPKTLEARLLIDQIAAALGACTCGVGSAS